MKAFLIKTALGFLVSSALAGGAYTYFIYTQKKIQELSQQVTAYEINIRQCENSLANIKADKERIEKETAVLQDRVDRAEDYQQQLIRTLQRHDLTRLTLEKPGLIETRVNDATKKVFEDIESISRND